MSVAESLAEVRARIAAAARACGRAPASVKLVAVSKKKPAEAIRAAYEAGQRAFGESYAQELEIKARALEDLDGLEWHFIGHLQTNKAKVAARIAHAVHALDSAGLARALGRRVADLGRPPLPVFVEVNVAAEPQKHGARVEDVGDILAAIEAEPSLRAVGLMTVPPAGALDVARRTFEALRALRDRHGGVARLPELSMGMSHDLEAAVATGATLVRIGTAIFGER